MKKVTRMVYNLTIDIEDLKNNQEILDKIRNAADNATWKVAKGHDKVHQVDLGFDYQDDVSEDYIGII